jgi:hypothetical protein
MAYEISNPHDTVTIEAASDSVAGVTVLLLGEGAFGCNREDGATLPTIVVGDSDHVLHQALDAFGVERMDDLEAGERLSRFVELRKADIAAALESLLYVGLDRRLSVKTSLMMLGDFDARARSYNARQRTSTYDIGERAMKFAQRLRQKLEHERITRTGRTAQ